MLLYPKSNFALMDRAILTQLNTWTQSPSTLRHQPHVSKIEQFVRVNLVRPPKGDLAIDSDISSCYSLRSMTGWTLSSLANPLANKLKALSPKITRSLLGAPFVRTSDIARGR